MEATAEIKDNETTPTPPPVEKEVDRQVQVFSPPKNAPAPAEVPESFYKINSNQVAKLYKAQVAYRQGLEEAPLKTQKMRNAEELDKMKKYPKTTLRVRLPDHTILQAVFESKEKVAAIYEFIGSTLATPDRAFLLCLPPRTKLTEPEITIYKAGLAPASNVLLVWLDPKAGTKGQSILNQEYMDKIKPLDLPSTTSNPPTPPPKDSSSSPSSSSSSSNKTVPKWLKKGLFKK
ncbi:unnamed protein product [Cunninghamella blakesleeana]